MTVWWATFAALVANVMLVATNTFFVIRNMRDGNELKRLTADYKLWLRETADAAGRLPRA